MTSEPTFQVKRHMMRKPHEDESMSSETTPSDPSNRFSEQSNLDRPSLASEFVEFLKWNKKWWLLPILVVLILVGVLMVAGGSAAAPFIYTLF